MELSMQILLTSLLIFTCGGAYIKVADYDEETIIHNTIVIVLTVGGLFGSILSSLAVIWL